MREWTAVYVELAMEVAVKAAAMKERARLRRQRVAPPVAAQGGGRPAKGSAAPQPPYSMASWCYRGALPLIDEAKGETNSWLLLAAPKTRVSSLYIGGDNASRPFDGWPLDPMALGRL